MPRRRAPRPARTDALSRLVPEEAARVLRSLLAAHPELVAEARRLAGDVLDEVAADGVALHLEAALRDLDIDDLNERAGTHHGVYVEPGEAAWELLTEALEPHLADMERRVAAGSLGAATETLRGCLRALYAVRAADKPGTVLDWAPDFAREAASDAVHRWRGHGRAVPRSVLDDEAPDWAAELADA